ncbi:MAG: hypothetical protein F6K56_02325, partial [Moorea sp. SIO3G5]|nr:hypothetical protein [Moorena sp. SIO3G5]
MPPNKLLFITNNSFFNSYHVHSIFLSTYYLLPITYYLLPITYYLFPVPCSLLPT